MDRERWHRLSFVQQMGNIGSEFARARHWQDERDEVQRVRSLERALELIDLTLEDARCRTAGRLKELTRMREVASAWYASQRIYGSPEQFLEDYCTRFSLTLG